MRRLAFNIVFGIGVFIFMLLVAEGAWRIFVSRGDLSRTFDPELGLVNESNATWTIRTPEYVTTMETNARGFRGPEFPVGRAPSERRILFLGDSFVEAKQVSLEDRFVEQTASTLSESLKVPIITRALAVGGAEPAREFSFYEHLGSAFEPDVVVQVFFLENDLLPIDGSYRFREGKNVLELDDVWAVPPPSCGIKCMILKKSEIAVHLYRFLRQLHATGPRDRRSLLGEGEFFWYTKEGQDAAESERRFEVLAAFADAIRTAVEEQGGEYLAVLMPGAFEMHPAWADTIKHRFPSIPSDTWNTEGLLDTAAAALLKRDIDVLDLRVAFRDSAESGEILYYQWDPHLNPKGHALAAQALAEAVLSALRP